MNYYSLCKNNQQEKIDKKLDDLFGKKCGGFFIELGAFDGITQSNTCFFERNRGWKGILIEPQHDQYLKCCANRPNSVVIHGCCVSNEYPGTKIVGDFAGSSLLASTMTEYNNGNILAVTPPQGMNSPHIPGKMVEVDAYTLEKILDMHYDGSQEIDFLSLDTEGYELQIIRGLNLDKYRPIFLLIEIMDYNYDAIVKYLQDKQYTLVRNFSGYNKKDNPYWGGNHNDYLFARNNANMTIAK